MTDAQKPRTRENIEADLTGLCEDAGIRDGKGAASDMYDEIRTSVLAELAAQEPVAWRLSTQYGQTIQIKDTEKQALSCQYRCATDVVQPLYAQPMPPADQTAGWRPIRTAPKDGTNILACGTQCFYGASPDERFVSIICWHGNRWQDGTIADQPKPTHWMPLPDAPQHETREGGK